MNVQTSVISVEDALIYGMVTLAAVDRVMTDRELRTIGDVVRSLPVFRDYDTDRVVPTAEACGAILRRSDGLDTVLEMIAEALPERLYETAYALAVEVAAADLFVEQEELRFLQILRDRLNLDKLTSAAIERAARARFRKL
jgi:tellurite resistance protein